MISDTLQDWHMWSLAQEITSDEKLHDVGTGVLKLPKRVIDAARSDHRTSIVDAAYNVLSAWLKKQTNRKEAYINLHDALRSCQMKPLADKLKQWVKGTDDTTEISGEGKK